MLKEILKNLAVEKKAGGIAGFCNSQFPQRSHAISGFKLHL